jgi:hypothetical protein
MYRHITTRDQANVVTIERLLFRLKKKGSAKQMWMTFLKISNANWTWTVEISSLVYIF